MKDNLYYLIIVGVSGSLLLASSVIYFYIRYQRRFLMQKAAMQDAEIKHRQYVLNEIIQSQEKERVRISKDLHDHIGSSLSNLRFMVARVQSAAPGANALMPITDEYKQSIDKIIQDVRNISHSLSPAGLSLWGFHEAMEDFCFKMGGTTGLDIQVIDHTGGILKQLPFDEALSLFRVIQELLTNTVKHAAARHVKVTSDIQGENVTVQYSDDGKGTDLDVFRRRGIGMYNIESRLQSIQAAFDIKTSAGNGFIFTIRIPLRILNNTKTDD